MNIMENVKEKTNEKVNITLPKRRIYKTPRLLLADAYTIGADKFQSVKAKEKSTYYIVFRRNLVDINPELYVEGDNRIVFMGLSRILEKLFYEPITHSEIDESLRFLKNFKVTTKGLSEYQMPENIWRKVVDEFNGRPPINIKALPEGSVVYPNEPCVQISAGGGELSDEEFGELAAWFESKLLQVWAASERVTQDRHWFKLMVDMVKTVNSNLSKEETYFLASLMLTDFGDRAGMTAEESEELGMYHLYTWGGTDTVCGAYQAWKNSGETPGIATSVNALAHRNVQAYDFEGDVYNAIYDAAEDGEILSMVADCYDFFYATENHLLPLAKRSVKENNGKVVVARPDSGDPLAQVLWVCNLAVKHGLYTEQVINGKTWKFATTLRFIEGDGMDFKTMKSIINALLEEGFAPFGWGLFGVGGGLRNNLKRDNLSAKYALCAMGDDNQSVVKFSETLGKTTLPGPFKILRSEDALKNKKTIVFENEEGEDAMVEYFNGSRIEKPFGEGMDDYFNEIKDRINAQFDTMPLTLQTEENHNYPASDEILNKRLELLEKYAPSKSKDNY
jgi:nicotinamide phosphoribosyltransferase